MKKSQNKNANSNWFKRILIFVLFLSFGAFIGFGVSGFSISTDLENVAHYVKNFFVTSDGTDSGDEFLKVDGENKLMNIFDYGTNDGITLDGSNISMSGDLNAGGDGVFIGNLDVKGGSSLSGVEISNGILTGDKIISDNIEVLQNLGVSDNLSVDGVGYISGVEISNGILTGDKIISDNIEVLQNLVVSGDLNLGNNMHVQGTGLFEDDVSINGTLDVEDIEGANLPQSGNMPSGGGEEGSILENLYLSGGNLYVEDNIYATGGINIVGNSIFQNNLDVSENIQVGGGLETFTGNVALSLLSGNVSIGSSFNTGANLTVPGNVGIGTNNPLNKLDIRGGLKVGDGNIYSNVIPTYLNPDEIFKLGEFRMDSNNTEVLIDGYSFLDKSASRLDKLNFKVSVRRHGDANTVNYYYSDELETIGDISVFEPKLRLYYDKADPSRIVLGIENTGTTHTDYQGYYLNFFNRRGYTFFDDERVLTLINPAEDNLELVPKDTTNLKDFRTYDLKTEGDGLFGGSVGIGTTDPKKDLDVRGDAEISRHLDVGGMLTTTGSAKIGSDLTVTGNTKLGSNLEVMGDTYLSGTLNFTNPANIPWMDKDTNLPFTKLGSTDFYLPPDVKGDFVGQVHPRFNSISYYLYEDNGTLVGLRRGTNYEEEGLFYYYNRNGNYNSLNNTDIKYEPAFLEYKTETPIIVVDGTNNSLTFKTDEGNYYLVQHRGTLDPSKHTSDIVINVTDYFDGTKLNLDVLNRVQEVDQFIGFDGHLNNLQFYIFNKDLEEIEYTNTMSHTSRTKDISNVKSFGTPASSSDLGNTIFKINSSNYVDFEDTSSCWSIRGNQAEVANINYEIDGDKLIFHQAVGNYCNYDYTARGRSVGFSNMFIYDISSSELYYRNEMPMYVNVNNTDPENGFYSTRMSGPTNFYYDPKRKEVLISRKPTSNARTAYYDRLYQVENKNSFYDFLSEYKGTATEGLSYVDYIPYDASYLGKDTRNTRWIGMNRLFADSYSHRTVLNEETGIYEEKSNSNSLDIYLPELSVDHVSNFPSPISLTKTNGDLDKIKTTYLNFNNGIDYNFYGYYLSSDNINKIDLSEGGSSVKSQINLPNSWESTINNWLDNDSNPSNYGLSNNFELYKRTTPAKSFQIINENFIGIDVLYYWYDTSYSGDSDNAPKEARHKYIVYDIQNDKIVDDYMYETATYNKIDRGDTVRGHDSIYEQGVYENENYIYILNRSFGVSRRGGQFYNMIKLNKNGEINSYHKLSGREHWTQVTLGVHPYFGFYSNSRIHGSTHMRTIMRYYKDNGPYSNLKNRIDSISETWMSLSKGVQSSSNGGDLTIDTILTIQQPEGFNIYTSESDVFVEGSQSYLTTRGYDLANPDHGLVKEGDDPKEVLSYKTIYGYIPNLKPGLPAEFKFSFHEPSGYQTLLEIKTGPNGISKVYVIDGLNISGETVSVNNLNVRGSVESQDVRTNRLFLEDDGGNMREIKISTDGNLYVE